MVIAWTDQETEQLLQLVGALGNKRWEDIAARLGNGRTAQAVQQRYKRFHKLIGKSRLSRPARHLHQSTQDDDDDDGDDSGGGDDGGIGIGGGGVGGGVSTGCCDSNCRSD